MSRLSDSLDPKLAEYLRDFALRREDDVLAKLSERTGELPDARMQISVEQGQFMTMLVKLLGVTRALEVGTFTGYSSICVARALPPGGKLVACDVSEEWTAIAREFWQEAGVADRIELRIGPASATLKALRNDGEEFDFAFIDADKVGYADYYEQSLAMLRPGGVIALDNAFMHGRVVEPPADDAGATAVSELNAKIAADDRVEPSLLPIGDGLMLARKR